MKLFTAILFSMFSLQAAFAIDLNQATNQQLLDEVSRRLSGTPSGTGGATATYICDNAYLKISTVGETKTGEASVYIGAIDKCLAQTSILNQYKSKIASLKVAAVCDNAYLKRYALYTSGELKELSSDYIGNYDRCLDQAKVINQN